MPPWTPIVSRFLATIRPEPSNLSPARISHGSASDSESQSINSTRSDEVIEILDSDEESDWEAIATDPEDANSTRVLREISIELSQSVCNSSLSDFSDASDSLSVISLDSLAVLSDQANDDYSSPPLSSMSNLGASLGTCKDTLSEPKASIWGRDGARLAMVIFPKKKNKDAVDNASTLRALSASRQNAIAGTSKKDQGKGMVSTSRKEKGFCPRLYRDLRNNMMAPSKGLSSSRPRRSVKRKSYVDNYEDLMDVDRSSDFSDQIDEYEENESESDVDNLDDKQVDDSTFSDDEETSISDLGDENLSESEDEMPPAKRVKRRGGEAEKNSNIETQKAPRVQKKLNPATVRAKKSIAGSRAPKKSKVVTVRAKTSIAGPAEDQNPRSFADPNTKFGFENILDYGARPLITIPEIFEDLTDQIRKEGENSLRRFCKTFSKKPLRVLTMCSGTESPILAMQQIQKTLVAKYTEEYKFIFDHLGSAEIHPAKAAYIQKNFPSKTILRDIIELTLLEEKPKPHFMTTMYGGKAEVPGNIDILIAGFACDDFSMLNNVRKTLEEKGESGDTFFAVKTYMKLYRPKIVILENVINAPWYDRFNKNGEKIISKKLKNGHKQDTSIETHLENAGYKTIFFRMDTKEHYLPHTRVRGYMVCVPETSIASDEDWTRLTNTCRRLVDVFKRQASAPVEAFLFPADDPGLKVLVGDHKSEKKPPKWDKCFVNHLDYSLQLGLGDKHPISNWKPDGSRELPDYHIPMPGMTERVADSLDISHKRNLLRGFDDRFCNRQLEFSQNVYRIFDTLKFGIQTCLCPSNMAFSTFYGRRITGAEAARLQGIDLDQVDTTNMSEQLLLDMCGNAMTSTVVGSVIFAALLTFQGMFDVTDRAPAVVESEPSPCHEGEEALIMVELKPSDYTPVSVQRAKALAKLTCRLCLCEGHHDTFEKPFQKCKLCGHITCVKCGKQPKHEYVLFNMAFINKRMDPIEFDDIIKKSIPMEIDLNALHSSQVETYLKAFARQAAVEGFDMNDLSQMLDAFKNALQSRVFFRSVRRAEAWHVLYESDVAILKLIISASGVEWQLYANVSREPLDTFVGRYFRQYPIARMTPDGNDIVKGLWGYWLPIKKVFKATVTSSGPLLQTYKNACGLVSSLHQFNHSHVDISFNGGDYDPRYFPRDIRGHYVAAPACGQAFDSLHLLTPRTPGEKPFGLFFYHEMQSGFHPAGHSFVLGSDFERKDWGNYHALAGQFSASWRQPIIQGIEGANPLEIYVEGTGITVESYSGCVTDEVDITVPGRFVSLGTHSLIPSGPSFKYNHLPADITHLDLSCEKDASIFSCMGKVDYEISCRFPKNKWTQIDRTNRATFWPKFSWAILQGLKINGHCEVNNKWHSWTDIVDGCLKCAPTEPALLWTLNRKGKRIPYEHPEEASEWEKSMKCRPSPMSVLFHADNHGNITLRVSMNPVTLMHQAKARLLINGCKSPIDLTWRLVTDDGRKQNPEYKRLTLRNNDNVEMAPQPFSTHMLRDEQLRVLTWLIEKEVNGTSFTEEEVVESLIPDIGYRAEGRATRDILRRGGILAQDVGFGKTVVMLALIQERGKSYKGKAPIFRELPGSIYTPATLIMVPPHLVDQWNSEVAKFRPEIKSKVIIIQEPRHFSKLTIKQITEAEIVIVNWGACVKPAYIKMLANFGGIVEPADNPSNREHHAWYKTAISAVEDSVDTLRRSSAGFTAYLEKKWLASVEEASSVDVRVPSKHVTGSAYVNSVKRQSSQSQGEESDAGLKRKRATAKPKPAEFKHTVKFQKPNDWHSMIYPFIELFHWVRIIVDEHTYGNGFVGTTLANLKADNYWLLSGTPALGGHGDVKILASLLGINLGVDDFTELRSDIFRQKTSDMTKSELFMTYQECHSPKWREYRHEHAQKFLDHFCSKDVANLDHIQCTIHFRLVDQSPSEQAIYLELVQHLAPTEFIIVRINAFEGDRAKHIQDVASGSGDGKPALFMRASHFTFDESEDTSDLCKAIVDHRIQEHKASLENFKYQLKRTYWLHIRVNSDKQDGDRHCHHFTSFEDRIHKNHLGDKPTTDTVQAAIEAAKKAYREDDWKEYYRPAGKALSDKDTKPLPEYPTGLNNSHGVTHVTRMAFELRTWASKLSKLTTLIVHQERSLRFIQNVRLVQCGGLLTCSHCGASNLKPNDVKVMAQCGHLLAVTCCSGNDCPVIGCKAFNREYQKLAGSGFGQAKFDSCSSHGSKMDAVLELIQHIVEDKDEKVLVFVQHKQSTDKLEATLKDAGILYSDLRNETTSSDVLNSYQTGKASKNGAKPSKVLILNIGDANASGSNLTVANHVIFLQPYYTSGENAQQTYKAAMTQAIGRARRYGQTKEVHVYHFLTVNTIDIDYFEARNNAIITRRGNSGKAKSEGVFNPAGADWKTELGTYFARQMKFDGALRSDH